MARKSKAEQSTPARMLAIVRDPAYKKWGAAIRALERTLEKRGRDEVEASAVRKARDKALDAYNWLRALPITPEELEQEYARYRAVVAAQEAAEAAAYALRQGRRQAQIDVLSRPDDSQTRYVPGIGYVRGNRVLG